MRYAIVANPASGKTNIEQKISLLSRAAEILDTEIHGLDTSGPDSFAQCARDLCKTCDVLVVAGGDGTFSNIINSLDTAQIPTAFIPLGTGNAMGHALGYKRAIEDIALRIKNGPIRNYDLIECLGKRRGLTLSIGIEGAVIKERDRYIAGGYTGFMTYLAALISAYFRKYRPASGRITLDNYCIEAKDILSLMVVKHPYYGYGIKVVPGARLDDGLLHVLFVGSGLLTCARALATTVTIGNRAGRHMTCRYLHIKMERPLELQIDGTSAWKEASFEFNVLPGALKMKG